jgi:hypothetical protein
MVEFVCNLESQRRCEMEFKAMYDSIIILTFARRIN